MSGTFSVPHSNNSPFIPADVSNNNLANLVAMTSSNHNNNNNSAVENSNEALELNSSSSGGIRRRGASNPGTMTPPPHTSSHSPHTHILPHTHSYVVNIHIDKSLTHTLRSSR